VRLLHVEHPDGGGPGVFADVAPLDTWRAWQEPPPEDGYDAIVLYGGVPNVADGLPWMRDELAWLRERLDDGAPVLGLCLGSQLLATALGAEVARSRPPEIGWHPVELTAAGREDPVVGALPERFDALQWHSWTFTLPDGADLLATSAACPQAFRHGRRWGVQFHPEVDRATLDGWNAMWDTDPDATGPIAPEPLDAWSALGRELFASFLEHAVRPSVHGA
jgi:GMP synthase-like glutamine amidotransferase